MTDLFLSACALILNRSLVALFNVSCGQQELPKVWKEGTNVSFPMVENQENIGSVCCTCKMMWRNLRLLLKKTGLYITIDGSLVSDVLVIASPATVTEKASGFLDIKDARLWNILHLLEDSLNGSRKQKRVTRLRKSRRGQKST